MKRLMIIFAIFLIGVLLLSPTHAQVKKVAQTGLQFLKVDMGTRAAAMGGSYLMVGDDASALFYNPAGIAKMQGNLDLFVTQTQWIAGIVYNGGAVAKSLGNWGTVGLSFVTGDYGDDMIGTMYDGTTDIGYLETGSLNVGAYAIGVGYAKALTDKFTVGGQIKYAYQNLAENKLGETRKEKNEVSGLAYDFGTMFYPGFKSFRLGMTIRNFSPEFKYVEEGFELPLTFVLGFAMDVMDFFGEHQNPLVLSVDATHPRDYTERIHLGAEYCFMDMISLRAGYKFNYDIEGLSAGIGFKKNIGTVNVDLGYSFSDVEFFDAVNRISFGVSF